MSSSCPCFVCALISLPSSSDQYECHAPVCACGSVMGCWFQSAKTHATATKQAPSHAIFAVFFYPVKVPLHKATLSWSTLFLCTSKILSAFDRMMSVIQLKEDASPIEPGASPGGNEGGFSRYSLSEVCIISRAELRGEGSRGTMLCSIINYAAFEHDLISLTRYLT